MRCTSDNGKQGLLPPSRNCGIDLGALTKGRADAPNLCRIVFVLPSRPGSNATHVRTSFHAMGKRYLQLTRKSVRCRTGRLTSVFASQHEVPDKQAASVRAGAYRQSNDDPVPRLLEITER